jgi:hypothetical protein
VNVETTKLAEGRHTIGVGSRTRRATGSSGRHAASFRVRNARPNDRPAARTRHGRVRMWFAVNRQIHVTTRVGRRVATRLAARPPRPRDPRRLNRDLPLGPRSPAPAQDRHAQPQAWATDVDPAFESDRDARGRRRVAFYRRASLPGPATSRANHVLTTRNRRGGPQDTQPGPDGYRRDSSPPATARPARKAHDSAGRDEPARTRWRCTRGPDVGPKRRGASRVTTLMDDAAPKPAAQYSADSWRPGVPWLRKVVTFGGPHRGRARRRHPAERPRRQRAQGLRGRTGASGVPRPRHPANRATFAERVRHAIARARREARTPAVIFLDLDDLQHRQPFAGARGRRRGARRVRAYYNRRRPHSSVGDRPPISRVHNVREQEFGAACWAPRDSPGKSRRLAVGEPPPYRLRRYGKLFPPGFSTPPEVGISSPPLLPAL